MSSGVILKKKLNVYERANALANWLPPTFRFENQLVASSNVVDDLCLFDHIFDLTARTSRKMANKVSDPMVILGAQRMILGAELFSKRHEMGQLPKYQRSKRRHQKKLQNMPWYEELLLAQIIYSVVGLVCPRGEEQISGLRTV